MSATTRLFPEGTVLPGGFEVQDHLAAVRDGQVYTVVDGGSSRPRRRLLLCRPLEAPPDLRPVNPDAEEGTGLIPAVVAAFESGDQRCLALAANVSSPLSEILPLDGDDDAWAVLGTLVDGLNELTELGGADGLDLDGLYVTPRGLLCYIGPVTAAAPRPGLPILEGLAARIVPRNLPWSEELRAVLDEVKGRRGPADLASIGAALESLGGPCELNTEVGLVSRCGPRRARNEDAAAAVRQHTMACDRTVILDVLAVADGVGGHRDGQQAAALAQSSVLSALATAETVGLLAAGERDWSDSNRAVQQRLAQAFATANELVAALADEGESSPPGSTLVTAVRAGRRLFVAHVGDSRAYLYRSSTLERLTRDDSLVQQMIDRGELTPCEAFGHPASHALVRFLGSGAEQGPNQTVRLLRPGDRLLLCTDGVSDALRDERIAELLGTVPGAQAAAEALVRAAERCDGRDNATALVLDVSAADGPVER